MKSFYGLLGSKEDYMKAWWSCVINLWVFVINVEIEKRKLSVLTDDILNWNKVECINENSYGYICRWI